MDLLNEASNVAAVQQLLRTNPYWANYMAATSLSQPRFFPMQNAVLQGPLPLALAGTVSNSLPPPQALTSINASATISSSTLTPPSLTSTALPLAMFPFHLPSAGYTLSLSHCNLPESSKTPSISETKSETKSEWMNVLRLSALNYWIALNYDVNWKFRNISKFWWRNIVIIAICD